MPDPEVGDIGITPAKLLALVALEGLGLAVMLLGFVELYYFGGNPVSGDSAILVGSVMLTAGSIWFAKIYNGPKVSDYI